MLRAIVALLLIGCVNASAQYENKHTDGWGWEKYEGGGGVGTDPNYIFFYNYIQQAYANVFMPSGACSPYSIGTWFFDAASGAFFEECVNGGVTSDCDLTISAGTVGYHDFVEDEWGVNLPYSADLSNGVILDVPNDVGTCANFMDMNSTDVFTISALVSRWKDAANVGFPHVLRMCCGSTAGIIIYTAGANTWTFRLVDDSGDAQSLNVSHTSSNAGTLLLQASYDRTTMSFCINDVCDTQAKSFGSNGFDMTDGTIGSLGGGDDWFGRMAAFQIEKGVARTTAQMQANFEQLSTSIDTSVDVTLTRTTAGSAWKLDGSTYYPTLIGPSQIRTGYEQTSGKLGVLVEESVTNYALYSQDFDDATWTETNITATADQQWGYGGGTTADTLSDADGTNPGKLVQEVSGLTAAVAYEASVYGMLKTAGKTDFAICLGDGVASYTSDTIAFVDSDPDTITDSGNQFVAEDFGEGDSITISGSASNDGTYTIDTGGVAAGTITLIGGDSLSAEAAGATVTITVNEQFICDECTLVAGNYSRCNAENTMAAEKTIATLEIYSTLCDNTTGYTGCTGDGTETGDGYFWGAQVEQDISGDTSHAFASSQIPTTSSTVTRNTDELVITGADISFDRANFTLCSWIWLNQIDTETNAIMSTAGGGGEDMFLVGSLNGTIQYTTNDGINNNTHQCTSATISAQTWEGVCVSVGTSGGTATVDIMTDGAICKNNSTASFISPPVTNVLLGKQNVYTLHGYLRDTSFFPVKLTDDEMIDWFNDTCGPLGGC